jgi:hypothetical protein
METQVLVDRQVTQVAQALPETPVHLRQRLVLTCPVAAVVTVRLAVMVAMAVVAVVVELEEKDQIILQVLAA